MPYITAEKQTALLNITSEIEQAQIENAGELNFLLTKLIIRYMKWNGTRYQYMNDVVGALDSAKAEFQRRVVNPYEIQKAHDNPDPYENLNRP